MAQELEQIIGKLLLPDNETIKEGTLQLKAAVSNPEIVPLLCTVLGSSQNAQVRQYAAVLLKNRLKSKKQWQSLDEQVTHTIRQNILQVLLQEPEKQVCKAICQLIGVIAKHDLPQGKWPELFQFLQTYITSQSSKQREIGMYVLQTLSARCGEQLQPHFGSLLHLCNITLEDKENPLVPFYTLQTLTEMVPLLGTEELKPFQAQVPKILAVCAALVQHDEEQATEALEIFDELVESEVSIIAPHIRPIVEFCLQVGANQELGDALRVKALSFIMLITKHKRKTIIKLKLTVPILNVVFPIMCTMPSDDEDDDDYEEAETHSPSAVAGQVIDQMSLHLPPEKFIPPLMRLIEPALASEDPLHRRAGYMGMAVAAEGCADHIMSKLLKPWLSVVYTGLQDTQPMVRNSALFALGQFSEHLQPEISKYSAELLPILFEYLGKATHDVEKDPRGVTKVYYALETFVENLGKDLLPHLPQLMEYLLTSISGSTSHRAKELAISALAATANAAEKEMVPYFPHIVELFKSFLQPTEDEHELKVQVQALDTLGVLARTLEEHFEPVAVECINVGLQLLETATDPDLRRCLYGLFGAVSTILKENMTKYLEVMVKNMITSVKSTEGVTAHYDNNESQLFSIFEEENIEEEEDNNADVEGISVENSYMMEKEDACTSLGELALNTGVGFMLYMEECYKEVSDLHDYPTPDVRRAAVTAVCQFCCAVSKIAKETNSTEAQTAMHSMLNTTVPKYLMIVKEDKDREVVTDTLEELKTMVEKIGTPVLQGENMVDNFMNIVREVILRKTSCQDSDECDEEDDQEAELDSMLIEDAGELLPAVAKVIGGDTFSPYFAGFMPELIKKTKRSTSASVPDRSFAMGTMAETLDALGPASSQFVQPLYPVFTNMLKDGDEEVRSNSVYALGVLAANGGDQVYSHYPHILKNLFVMLNTETDKRCLDNICAAVCRMITTRIQDVPMHQVFPVIMQCLPLKEDKEEYKTVLNCLTMLYQNGHPEMMKNLPQLVNIISQILCSKGLEKDTVTSVSSLAQAIYSQQPDVVNSVVTSISQEQATKLQQCLQVTNGTA